MFRQVCSLNSIPYQVQNDDSFEVIANKFGATINDMIMANPNLDFNQLKSGMIICIPINTQYYPSCPSSNYYIVTEEDTFSSIADYFNLTVEQLYLVNYGINPDDLYVDQVLCIPAVGYLFNIIIDTTINKLSLYRNKVMIKQYPIARDDLLGMIPKGEYIILNKRVDPGVDEGARWLGLSKAGLGIHGMNPPRFIELVSSLDSIVMRDEDISELFNLVSVGSTVLIV